MKNILKTGTSNLKKMKSNKTQAIKKKLEIQILKDNYNKIKFKRKKLRSKKLKISIPQLK